MNDHEAEMTRRFIASAKALTVTPPPWPDVVARATRQRRRRRRTLTTAGVVSVVFAVIGLIAVTARPTPNGLGAPRASGTGPASAASAANGATVETAAGPASTQAAGPSMTLAVDATTPSPDAWSRLPDSPLAPRIQPLVVSTGTGILVWGGYDSARQFTDGAYYNAQQRTWYVIPPAPLAAGLGDAVGVWTGAEVVAVNGTDKKVKSAAFNPVTMTWRALDDPPVDYAVTAASKIVALDGTVILVSVVEDGGEPHDQVAQLDDVASGRWSVIASPPVALDMSVDMVAGADEVYLVGNTHQLNECYVLHVLAYSPATGKWRNVPAEPVASRADPVTVWTGSELFIGGGGTCANGIASPTQTNLANLYNPRTRTWRTGEPAPDGFWAGYRFPDTWTGASVVAFTPGGVLLLYNPATDAWHRGPIINAPNPITPFETPQAIIDHTLVIAGGQITSGGEPCCDPFIGTYAYTIPDGF